MILARKRIAILAEEGFEDSELVEPVKDAYPAIPDLPEFDRPIIEALGG